MSVLLTDTSGKNILSQHLKPISNAAVRMDIHQVSKFVIGMKPVPAWHETELDIFRCIQENLSSHIFEKLAIVFLSSPRCEMNDKDSVSRTGSSSHSKDIYDGGGCLHFLLSHWQVRELILRH